MEDWRSDRLIISGARDKIEQGWKPDLPPRTGSLSGRRSEASNAAGSMYDDLYNGMNTVQ
jgi:hypothetical protein